MQIAFASGKGGSGKTTVSANLAAYLADNNYSVTLADCDVEEPNAHFFVPPVWDEEERSTVPVPEVLLEKCLGESCKSCVNLCRFRAIVWMGEVMTFPEMCHGCGLCFEACPAGALREETRTIGTVSTGKSQLPSGNSITVLSGRMRISEAMAPPLIKDVLTAEKTLRNSTGFMNSVANTPTGNTPSGNTPSDINSSGINSSGNNSSGNNSFGSTTPENNQTNSNTPDTNQAGGHQPVSNQASTISAETASQITIRDCPPGTSCPMITSVEGADFVVLVTEPTPFGLHDAQLAAECLKSISLPFGVIINRNGVGDDRVEQWVRQEEIPLLGTLPYSTEAASACSEGKLMLYQVPEMEQRFSAIWQSLQNAINGRTTFSQQGSR